MRIGTLMCVCVRVCLCVRACMHECVCVCIRARACVCVLTFTHNTQALYSFCAVYYESRV